MASKKYIKLVLLVFILLSSVAIYLVNADKNIIAKTDNYKIYLQEVSDYIRVSKMQYDALFGREEWNEISNTDRKKDKLISNVVDNILLIKIHTTSNERDNVAPSEDKIDKFIGTEDVKETKELLKKYEIPDNFFRTYIRDNINDSIYKERYMNKTNLSVQEIKNYYLKHKEKYSEKFENIKDTVRQDIKEEYYRKHEDALLKKERKKIYNEKYRLLYRIFK